MLPSSVEEGMLWPKAMGGVVRPARVPTTPRWLPPALPLLIQGGECLPGTYVAMYSMYSCTCFKLCCARKQNVVLKVDVLVQVFLKLLQCLIQAAESRTAVGWDLIV